jgi:hypothetical protein
MSRQVWSEDWSPMAFAIWQYSAICVRDFAPCRQTILAAIASTKSGWFKGMSFEHRGNANGKNSMEIVNLT